MRNPSLGLCTYLLLTCCEASSWVPLAAGDVAEDAVDSCFVWPKLVTSQWSLRFTDPSTHWNFTPLLLLCVGCQRSQEEEDLISWENILWTCSLKCSVSKFAFGHCQHERETHTVQIRRTCLWVLAEVLMPLRDLKASTYERSTTQGWTTGCQIRRQGHFCILQSWGLRSFRAWACQAEELAGTRGLGRGRIRAVRLLQWKPVFQAKRSSFCCCSPHTDMQ